MTIYTEAHDLIADINAEMRRTSGMEVKIVGIDNTVVPDYHLMLLIGLKYGNATWWEEVPELLDVHYFVDREANLLSPYAKTMRIEHHAFEVEITLSAFAAHRDRREFAQHCAYEFTRRWQDEDALEAAKHLYETLSEENQATMRTLLDAPYLRLRVPSINDYMHLMDGFGNQSLSLKPDIDPAQDARTLARYDLLVVTGLVRMERWFGGGEARVSLTDKGLMIRQYLRRAQSVTQ